MAPLSPYATARLLIEYTAAGHEHVAQLRLPSGSGTAEAVTVYNAIAPLMASILATTDWVLGARFGAAGSNLTFPLSVAADAGETSATVDPDKRPAYTSYTGRTSTGRRVRFTVFWPYANPDTDGWRDLAPPIGVAAILTELQDLGSAICGIDGNTPVWNNYANYGFNSYYQRKMRRTSI